jgi:hypothetical protein
MTGGMILPAMGLKLKLEKVAVVEPRATTGQLN